MERVTQQRQEQAQTVEAEKTPGETCPPSAAGGLRPPACAQAGGRLSLTLDKERITLSPGRWVVMVSAPGGRYVSIGVKGPQDALQRFDVAAPRSLARLRTGATDDDGKLPAFLSLATRDGAVDLPIIVDVTEPVELFRVDGDPKAEGHQQPLVGLPYPLESRAGYYFFAPTRYHFVRADVARALRLAFKQTRSRYKRKAIGIGDASQWNGVRPATDIGKPRHISHQGGRDVDIGLPVTDKAGALTRRCNGVLVEKDVLECAPGTVRDFDAERTAYLLGQLIDDEISEVEAIFTDQAYIDEIQGVLAKLRARSRIGDDAFSALAEDGILRPAPWHVDHIHIRFGGADAVIPKALDFDGTGL